MEILGSFLDEDWESLSQMFSSGENPDFLLHCNGDGSQIPSATFSPSHHAFSTNFSCISQESSNASEIDEALFLNIQGNQQQQQQPPLHHDHTAFESMIINNDIGFMFPAYPHDAVGEFLHMEGGNRAVETADSLLKRKSDQAPFAQIQDDDKSEDFPPQNPKKKPRNAQKSRAAQSKTSKKTIQDKINEEEDINGGGIRVSCSSYSSEEDSNANASNTKTRATKGPATDPQSLYARKRRERINERLKILQNLVPNGTKVDISTMLEEAVQYVKFLQLQIKLLSSDNLWMYAPLAYNGMDIGIYENISPNLMRP